jgi:hypothetical protein
LDFCFGPLDIQRHHQISGNFTASKSFQPDPRDVNSRRFEDVV